MRRRATSLLLILLACQLVLGLPVMRPAPMTVPAPVAADVPCPEHAHLHAPATPHRDSSHDCCSSTHGACHCSAATGLLADLLTAAPVAPRTGLLPVPHPAAPPVRPDALFRPPIA